MVCASSFRRPAAFLRHRYNRAKIMLMTGMDIEFKTKLENGRDELNNPTYDIIGVTVSDCLIAPITEPASAREQQAMHQAKDQVRVHLPKTFTGEIGQSYFAYNDKVFQLDSDSVRFMAENTPGRWDRYFRAESVGQFDADAEDVWLHFFITEDSGFVLAQE